VSHESRLWQRGGRTDFLVANAALKPAIIRRAAKSHRSNYEDVTSHCCVSNCH